MRSRGSAIAKYPTLQCKSVSGFGGSVPTWRRGRTPMAATERHITVLLLRIIIATYKFLSDLFIEVPSLCFADNNLRMRADI